MLARLKEQLPREEKLKMFGFDQNRILEAYKKRFPNGKLLWLYWLFLGLLFLSMLLFAWSVGMFR